MATWRVERRDIGAGQPALAGSPKMLVQPPDAPAGTSVIERAAQMHRARLGGSLADSLTPALDSIGSKPGEASAWVNMLRQASIGLRGLPAESVIFLGALAALEKSMTRQPHDLQIADVELSMELTAAAKRTLAEQQHGAEVKSAGQAQSSENIPAAVPDPLAQAHHEAMSVIRALR